MSKRNDPPPIKCDLEIFRKSDYHNRNNRHLNSKTFKVVGNDLNSFKEDPFMNFSNVECYKVNGDILLGHETLFYEFMEYEEDDNIFEKMKTLQSTINELNPKVDSQRVTIDETKSSTETIGDNIKTEQKQYYIGNNSFIQAALFAYSNHQHLVIRPDDVWIAIMTQLSFYISSNAEALRSKIVDFQDKKDLKIVVDATIFNAPYDKITLEMANLISNNIKDQSLKDWVIPNFSTTNETDRVVGASVLMSSMKEYFNYTFDTECGLPAVTMMGTLDDWKSIKVKAQRLSEFSLPNDKKKKDKNQYIEKWMSMLNPILDKFIETMELPDDKIDTKFWNKIASEHSESGTSYLDGWITVFCVFTPTGKWNGDTKEVDFYFEETIISDWPLIESKDIPSGYSQVDIKIIDGNQNPSIEYDSKMISGSYSVKFYDNNTTIVPQLNWSIFINDN